MSSVAGLLIPANRRNPAVELLDQLDLDHGDVRAKRTGFVIMLLLSAVIAIAGIIGDSTATVIGAMIIAPLSTPILGVAAGIVTGRASLVGRSVLWLVGGMVAVVVLGMLLSYTLPDPQQLTTNPQVTSRTAPTLMDLLAAFATGLAGAFAMCRRDLSNILPGVAISISLVPPLGVVGVSLGQGQFDAAFGASMLFLSNVVALIIAGSLVFTLAGYPRDPEAVVDANRRRAYTIVGVLTAVVAIPLVVNSLIIAFVASWTVTLHSVTNDWLDGTKGASITGVSWNGLQATVGVESPGGELPPLETYQDDLAGKLPSYVSVSLDVQSGSQVEVR
ncbi:TIGR00341 family protein [Agromyces cerinus]|uniref:TIGR00341 family protein n=1 Tax=Agromyces cerinus subsp. cerinus TaxID=232089 RepID=A0A1N6ERM7_9MICO|nr:TIGR00341 family protein [Agromyces cerinus]SIN85675.1 TIGR00341 family protein [Agromyces cerinus subsp. cerinus]